MKSPTTQDVWPRRQHQGCDVDPFDRLCTELQRDIHSCVSSAMRDAREAYRKVLTDKENQLKSIMADNDCLRAELASKYHSNRSPRTSIFSIVEPSPTKAHPLQAAGRCDHQLGSSQEMFMQEILMPDIPGSVPPKAATALGDTSVTTDNYFPTHTDHMKNLDSHSQVSRRSVASTRSCTQSEEEASPKRRVAEMSMFGDAEAMKQEVRRVLRRPVYNVTDGYYPTGIPQRLARSQWLDNLTMLIICTNAVWVAVDIDSNPAVLITQADTVYQIADNSFCAFFTVELLIRFLAFRNKADAFRDYWFCLDFSLVVAMVLETWFMPLFFFIVDRDNGFDIQGSVLRLVRLTRLVRLARMARLVNAVPEILILVKGMYMAARAVIVSLILMFLFIYVFAICFRILMTDMDVGEEYFSDVVESMWTLLIHSTFPDTESLLRAVRRESEALAVLLVVFILITSVTILNMLIGILCEVVSVVSGSEKERMMVLHVKDTLIKVINTYHIDADCDLNLDRREYGRLLTTPKSAKIIQEMGVDVEGLVDMEDYLFNNETQLPLASVMGRILDLRGSNSCTVKDLVDLRRIILKEMEFNTQKVQRWVAQKMVQEDKKRSLKHLPPPYFNPSPCFAEHGNCVHLDEV